MRYQSTIRGFHWGGPRGEGVAAVLQLRNALLYLGTLPNRRPAQEHGRPNETSVPPFRYAVANLSTTPIFDLERDLPKYQSHFWRALSAGIVLGIAVVLILILIAFFAEDTPGLNNTLFFPAVYFGILFHEVGHIAAGKLAGVSPGGISVGGFLLIKSGRNWIIRFDPKRILGGLAVPLPEQGDFSRGRFAWMVAGGPLASILLTGAFWLAYLRFGDGLADWIGTMVSGTALSITSLFPIKLGGSTSDGARLWQLFKHPERASCWMSVVALQAANLKGVQPRDWDGRMMQRALETDESEIYYPYVHMLAGFRSEQQGNLPQALKHLEIALGGAARNGSKTIRRWCYLTAAVESARQRGNVAQARVWLDRAAKSYPRKKGKDLEGVKARIAMAEGRYSEALENWSAYRGRIAERRLDSGVIRFEKERIEKAEQECRAALQRPEIRGAVSPDREDPSTAA